MCRLSKHIPLNRKFFGYSMACIERRITFGASNFSSNHFFTSSTYKRDVYYTQKVRIHALQGKLSHNYITMYKQSQKYTFKYQFHKTTCRAILYQIATAIGLTIMCQISNPDYMWSSCSLSVAMHPFHTAINPYTTPVTTS
jgi:hypothetical protein